MNRGNIAVDGYGLSTGTALPITSLSELSNVPVNGYGGGVVVVLAGKLARYDLVQFYRDGDDVMTLAMMSGNIGWHKREGWRSCSGVFAIPPDGRETAVAAIRPLWVGNKSADDTSLTTLINAALNQAGYRRPNGAPVA